MIWMRDINRKTEVRWKDFSKEKEMSVPWSSICKDLKLQDSRYRKAAAEIHQKWIFIEEQLHDLVSDQQQAFAEISGADKNLCKVRMCTFIFYTSRKEGLEKNFCLILNLIVKFMLH